MRIVAQIPNKSCQYGKICRKTNFFLHHCNKKNIYIYHLSPVTCHLSPVTCHMSSVTCHVSPVTYHLSHVITRTSTATDPALCNTSTMHCSWAQRADALKTRQVCPIDNRPSTDQLNCFVKKKCDTVFTQKLVLVFNQDSGDLHRS